MLKNPLHLAILILVAAPAWSQQQELPPAGPLVESLPNVVARVENHTITKGQLLKKAETMRQQALEAGLKDPAHMGKEFLHTAVDALIGEHLLYSDSRARGVTVPEAAIDQHLERMAAASPDRAAFEKLDQTALREQIRQELTIDLVFRREIAPGVELSDEMMREYYEANTARLFHPARVRVRQILKHVPAGGNEAEIRAALTALRQQIVAGSAEFGEAAAAQSDDAKTRDLGGDMGWLPLVGRKGSVQEMLAGLKTDEVSEVIRSQVGFHLFQVIAKEGKKTKTFEEAEAEIRHVLGTIEVRKEVQRRVEDLKARASIEIMI